MFIYFLLSNEIVMDFYDKFKFCIKGYVSFDYEFIENREVNLVKLDVRVVGDVVDAFFIIIDKNKVYEKGCVLVEMMKEFILR